MVTTTDWIVLVVCTSIALFIFEPILLYWFYKAYKYRHHSFIRLRHPRILFINCTLSCFCIVERCISLSIDLGVLPHYDPLIKNVCFVLFGGAYMHSYLLRHWLLFYDLGYREDMVNMRWEHDLKLYRSHWFLRHRSNLGNVKWMSWAVFALFIVVFISLFLLTLVSELIWTLGIAVYGVILSLIFLVISHKIASINPSLLIRKELFYVGIVVFCASITMFIVTVCWRTLDELKGILLSWTLSISLFFVLNVMSTWYQIKANTSIKGQSPRQQHRLPKQKITLRDVLKNEAGFKLFIRHLIKLGVRRVSVLRENGSDRIQIVDASSIKK